MNKPKLLPFVVTLIFIFIVIALIYSKSDSVNNVEPEEEFQSNSTADLQVELYFKALDLRGEYDYVYEMENFIIAAKYNEEGTITIPNTFTVEDQENSILSVLQQEKVIANWDILFTGIPKTGCYEAIIEEKDTANGIIPLGINYTEMGNDNNESCNENTNTLFEFRKSIAGSAGDRIVPFLISSDRSSFVPSSAISSSIVAESVNEFTFTEGQATVTGLVDTCFSAELEIVQMTEFDAGIIKLSNEENCNNNSFKDFTLSAPYTVSEGKVMYPLISL